MKNTTLPNYIKIYQDIISKKHPEKADVCKKLLSKRKLSFLEIIKLNELIFDEKDNQEKASFNQKLRSYNKNTILEILDFQSKNNLNNSQLAVHFNMSRNTIAKWKKQFLV